MKLNKQEVLNEPQKVIEGFEQFSIENYQEIISILYKELAKQYEINSKLLFERNKNGK